MEVIEVHRDENLTMSKPQLHWGSNRKRLILDTNWFFKQSNDRHERWRPVPKIPTNVHLDLMHNNLIPDPFVGKHETDVQWVGATSWVYRCKFISLYVEGAETVLVFDGLDTYATIVLNGEEILKTENMFIPERVNVSKQIRYDTDNVLEITFDSTYEIGKKLVEKHPNHHWGCWNGDPSRLAVRKAQYHYVGLTVGFQSEKLLMYRVRDGIGAQC